MTNPNTNGCVAATAPTQVLNGWMERCLKARDGHYKRSEELFYRSQTLGYILIFATVFVTVFSFFPYDSEATLFWGITRQHVVVLMGCISAVISGLVTQARYGERAEIHRSSGARYANLARDIELLQIKITAGIVPDADIGSETGKVIAEWNTLSIDSLLTPHNETASKLRMIFQIAILFAALFFVVASGQKEEVENPPPTAASNTSMHE